MELVGWEGGETAGQTTAAAADVIVEGSFPIAHPS